MRPVSMPELEKSRPSSRKKRCPMMADMSIPVIAGVRLGSDVLLDPSRLRGARVGIVCNHASVDRGFLAHRRPAGGGGRRDARGDLRPAARLPLRRAGQHDRDAARATIAARRVPVYSLYSETREPTAEMLRGLDVLVIDLQDVGARIYTYIYTMANCLRAVRAARRAGHRVRPAEPDRRRRRRRRVLGAGLRIVRRPVSDPDAARHDDRRAGAAVQRALRHRREARRRRRWRAGAATCTPTRPACRG